MPKSTVKNIYIVEVSIKLTQEKELRSMEQQESDASCFRAFLIRSFGFHITTIMYRFHSNLSLL